MVIGVNNSNVSIEKMNKYLFDLVGSIGNSYWKEKFRKDKDAKIHLAVMVQPYLSRILSGEKTIESRFSINMIAPFNRIKKGDIVVLKKSGDSVVALFEAGNIECFELNSRNDLIKIKEKYNDRLMIEDIFWEEKISSRYATLIDIQELLLLQPFKINKTSRTAWMTIGPIIHEDAIQPVLCNDPPIICISGKIASGKTYISKAIAERTGGARYSTSDYLRYILSKVGVIDPSREQLQQQGEIEMQNGWNHFVSSFLNYISFNNDQKITVIDGVRHLEFFHEIKRSVYPQKCLLIYIDTSDNIIQQRMGERDEGKIVYNHVTEGNLHELQHSADYISNGNINKVIEYIEKLS
jgi:dephospho-CoA kinase/ASC-1-like (ASCH) protein